MSSTASRRRLRSSCRSAWWASPCNGRHHAGNTASTTAAHASATDRTGRNTVIPRPCASWAKDEEGCRRRAPRCRAAAAVWSLETIIRILGSIRVVPLVTSGPQGLKDERGRARRTRAWAHEPPGRHAPWSVRMRRRDLLSVVNRRVGRPGPTPAAEAVHAGSGHRAQL
jgi:hypothetical protein